MYKLGVLGPDPKKDIFALYQPKVTVHQLPINVSYEYLFGPVEDQKQFGACVAFSTSALAEAIIYKRTHARINISEAALYSLSKHIYEPTELNTEGLYVVDALQVLTNKGYVLDQDVPYQDTAAVCLQLVNEKLLKTDHELKGFQRVDGNSGDPAAFVHNIKLALFEKGPAVFGIQFQDEWFTPEGGFLNANPHQAAGGHEMVFVGYSDTKQAFRIRNSWSTGWGDNGYCWLPYSSTVLPDDCYTISL